MRRKHRVVVEITMDEPTTAKRATQIIGFILDGVSPPSQWTGITKIARPKEFDRVFRAEIRWQKRRR
jgi:hypothetical protein